MRTRVRRRPHRARRPDPADLLQEQIKQIIIEDQLAPGDPMPTELDLIERLDAGRSSIREALKALRATGIVEIRHGFGTYVGQMSLSGIVESLVFQSKIALSAGEQDLRHLVDIREVIEHGMLAKLIELPDPPDLSAAAEVIEQMKKEAKVGHIHPETDRSFHEVLYQSLENSLLGPLLGAFWDVSNRAGSTYYGPTQESPSDTVRHHQAIYDAVRRRDLSAARTAMTEHFHGVRERLGSRR
ncbi:FadR/GntR family transcriptional regulator [Phytoactinopolyspora limicola]|uniref:FadR/GntR family transcriptional regulator n=1 Tax=Phytoactinopolyspora limicola TaxID=2715536 RepID=UPI00140ABE07|nr:FadR/GntR family transcriptional regulator [Phytoactinopolyspora limicola]